MNTAGFLNLGLSAPNLRACTTDTGLTTSFPNSMGTQTSANPLWWVGVS